MSEENVEFVKGIYGAFSRGDVPAVLGAFADDIEWFEAEGMPYGGLHRGPEAVAQNVFGPITEDVDGFALVLEEFLDSGESVAAVVRYTGTGKATVLDFEPYGYDERQYCSPAFDLPVGLFQRSKFGSFSQYHTSEDDLTFISPIYLAESLDMILAVVEMAERDYRPRSAAPKCEPQLGRRGLYASLGGGREVETQSMAILWVLNLADGKHSLLDIAERAHLPFSTVAAAAECLHDRGLLLATD